MFLEAAGFRAETLLSGFQDFGAQSSGCLGLGAANLHWILMGSFALFREVHFCFDYQKEVCPSKRNPQGPEP